MPRIKRSPADLLKRRHPKLVAELADELKSSRETGQPVIEEFEFPKTGAIRATVIWDKWDRLPDAERAATILDAYERAEGKEYRERIALPIGLTVREAGESGMLPFWVVYGLQKEDPFTSEQLSAALLERGAKSLPEFPKPVLRFSTRKQAEAAIDLLIAALPGSERNWTIIESFGPL